MTDDRFSDLGKTIWTRVVTIQSYHLAQQHGSANLRASVAELIRNEEMALWGDLQTLFRRGVFPEDLPPFDDPDENCPHQGVPCTVCGGGS